MGTTMQLLKCVTMNGVKCTIWHKGRHNALEPTVAILVQSLRVLIWLPNCHWRFLRRLYFVQRIPCHDLYQLAWGMGPLEAMHPEPGTQRDVGFGGSAGAHGSGFTERAFLLCFSILCLSCAFFPFLPEEEVILAVLRITPVPSLIW